jgi:menaquinone-9 beta-reductase
MAITYDLITVGGGLGGAALAGALAERGARVLVLEREARFKDRVRGEGLVPWGVGEARRLGLYARMRDDGGGLELNGEIRLGSLILPARDLITTTPQGAPFLSFYHPRMQETVLAWAAEMGAEVRRGVSVAAVEGGKNATAITTTDVGHRERLQARLIVGADGRSSMVRRWGGFVQQQDPERNIICGVTMENMHAPTEVFQYLWNLNTAMVVVIVPEKELTRAYLIHPHGAPYRLQNQRELTRFVEESVKVAPAEFYTGASPVGPLASFNAADTWVDHPYRDGIALIGDAAAASDPTYGQGMSLTLRDARVLRDYLAGTEDWDAAAHAYARDHDRYYGVIHTVDGWFNELLLTHGPHAAARRQPALSLMAEDPMRIPDHVMSGPDLPADETVRRRFFGEA